MQKKYKIVAVLLIVGISVMMSYLAVIKIHFLEDYIYRTRFAIEELKNKQIALVLIDDNAIKKIGIYPFKRSEYAKAIVKILEGKPKIIGIDIFFDGIRQLEDDLKLVEVLDKADNDMVLAVYPTEADSLLTNEIKLFSSHPYSYKNVIIGNVAIFKAENNLITKTSLIPLVNRDDNKEYLPFPIVIASRYLKADYKQKPLLDRGILVATLGDIEIPNPSDMLINYRKHIPVTPYLIIAFIRCNP